MNQEATKARSHEGTKGGDSAPAITAILPYFGAKRTLAPRIVAELGPHAAYWEPFCGSMAVLLAKPPCPMETVNDLYGEVVNLARVIQSRELGPMLYRRLRRRMMTERCAREAAGRFTGADQPPAGDEPDLERAEAFFYAAWVGRGGTVGTRFGNYGYSARFTKNGGHAAKRYAEAVSSIPAFRRRLMNVTVLNRDAFQVLGQIEDATGSAVYLDPPYVEKGASYVHDFEPGAHARLFEEASRFRRTRVVISYYDHPDLRAMYTAARGWTWVECPTTKAMVSAGKRDKTGVAVKAPEVLIINGPSLTAGGLFNV